jgi:hypothetical protein
MLRTTTTSSNSGSDCGGGGGGSGSSSSKTQYIAQLHFLFSPSQKIITALLSTIPFNNVPYFR